MNDKKNLGELNQKVILQAVFSNPEPQQRMKTPPRSPRSGAAPVDKSRIPIFLPAGIFLSMLAFLVVSDRISDSDPSAFEPAAVAEPPELSLAPASSAREIQPGRDDRSERLGAAIRAAMTAAMSPQPSQPAAMTPLTDGSDVPPDLLYQGAPLPPERLAALNRLRWQVPGKRLDWRTAAEKPVVTYLQGRRLEPAADAAEPGRTLAETTAVRFLRKNEVLLGAGDADTSWRLIRETEDDLGYTQVRFSQYWQGLEVWPGAAMLQTAPGGDLTLLTAAYSPEPVIDPHPQVPADVAREVARRDNGLMTPRDAVGAAELFIYAPLDSEPRLAWRVPLDAPPVLRSEIFVDARDASVIERMPLVVSTGVAGSGIDLNGQTRTLNLWQAGPNVFLPIDTSKTMYHPASQPPNLANSRGVIAVLDLQNSSQINPAAAVHITAGSANGPWNPHAVSASASLSMVYDYFLDRFGRNSADGMGGSMIALVNLNQSNAFADPQTQTLIFGNQDKYAEALDVVAHEMAHAVISTTSQLVYRFQSGALNESFADILGEGCEAHYNGGEPDWLMGTELSVQLRSMSDPASKIAFGTTPYPDRMSRFINLNADQDKGGVHINSSIVNHAFYQLAVGFDGAIGFDDALQIFFRAVTTKLNANSQFIDCRLACVQSAVELFGAGSTQALKTAEAFDFVEIFDQQATPSPVPTPAVDAPDSTLFVFPSGGAAFIGRREAQFGDPGAGVFLGAGGQQTQAMAFKKLAVRGDGAFGVYIRPDADGAIINTQTGEPTPFGMAGQFDSAAISADGNIQAYVLRDGSGNPDNRIYIFDQAANQSETYTVTQPLTDQTGAATSASVLFVDALALSADGRFVFYDALNRLSFPGGGFIDSWSISFIDREAGTIQNLISPIPGVNMGNPSLGQTRAELVTFDVVDANGVTFIHVANLATGALQPLTTLAGGFPVAPGWPGYSGDDTAVVYTNYFFNGSQWIPYLESQPVQSDGVSANGAPFAWLSGSSPQLGLIYRRGAWQGPPTLTVTATEPEGGDPNDGGTFLVSRSVATVGDTAFSFVLTGSAAPGEIYQQIPFSATIPAGQTSVSVPVTLVDGSAVAGTQTVIMTLSEGLGYHLGNPGSAALLITGDEPQTFAEWAALYQIGPTDFGGDPDGDGIPNLIEYALGTNPRAHDPPDTIRLIIEDDHAVLEVTRNGKPADVELVVQVSGTLSGPWASGAPETTALVDTTTMLRVRDNSPVSGKKTRFLRLMATKP